MDIDSLASLYLTAVYRGEIALKSADRNNIHTWAVETLDEILNQFNRIRNENPVNPIPSPSQVASNIAGIFPKKKDPKPRNPRKKRDFSLEFVEKLVQTLGGSLDKNTDDFSFIFSLPDKTPDYETALKAMKMLMKRAFEIQMITKGIWLTVGVAMFVMSVISTIVLFYRQTFVEFILVGSFVLISIYSFFKWRSLPSFPAVAKEIRELVYKGAEAIDVKKNQGKIETHE